MENSRAIVNSFLGIVSLGGVIFLTPFFVFAYDDITTHPALTEKIVDFYSSSYPDSSFSNEDRASISKGSIDEDSGHRWLNHFYDPVYNRGLEIQGSVQVSSKEWGTNTELQKGWRQGTVSGYFSGDADYTWDRAIYEYAWGDRVRGLETLGHILHLLEDATVPDHTRNDPHPPGIDGSPYEGWTQRFTPNTLTISTFSGEKPVLLDSIGAYFDSLAKYSNSGFFSKDTILQDEYALPKISFIKNEVIEDRQYAFGYGVDVLGNNYRLVKVEQRFGNREQEMTIIDKKDRILSDYWRHLSKQGILHGAGVLKLFRDEVEKEKKSMVLFNKNKSYLQKLEDLFISESLGFILGSGDEASANILSATQNKHETREKALPTIHRVSGTVAPVRNTGVEAVNQSLVVREPQISNDSPQAQNIPISEKPKEEPVEIPKLLTPVPIQGISPGFGGGSPVTVLPHSSGSAPMPEAEEKADAFPIINEVAWAGTPADSKDQWVELYNPSSKAIDLHGFVFFSETMAALYIPLSGSIPPHGFYLIESSESVVSSISADLVASFGDGISLNGEGLAIGKVTAQGTTTLDKIFLCENWCGKGSIDGRRSMERYETSIPGDNPENWDSNIGIVKNGKDKNEGALNGTPRARNSVTHLIHKNKNISDAVLLSKELSPYIVPRMVLISGTGSLVLDAGVVIKFAGSNPGFTASGTISARGTEAEPVVLTSITDDTHNGDTNGDGDATNPIPGSWSIALEIVSGSASTSDFTHARLLYPDFIDLDASRASFTDSRIESSVSALVLRNGSTVTLNDVLIDETEDDAVLLFDGSGIIGDGVKLQNIGESAILLFGASSANVSNTEMTDVEESGVLLFDGSTLSGSGIIVSGTGEDGIILFSRSRINLANSTVRDIDGSGVLAFGSNGAIGATIIENTESALDSFPSSNALDPGLFTISNSTIAGNSFGVRVFPPRGFGGSQPAFVDARNNWWGDPTGPFHNTRNSEGLGDSVSDLVDFEPFLTSAP